MGGCHQYARDRFGGASAEPGPSSARAFDHAETRPRPVPWALLFRPYALVFVAPKEQNVPAQGSRSGNVAKTRGRCGHLARAPAVASGRGHGVTPPVACGALRRIPGEDRVD